MKTILLADDNRGIREYCKQVLEDEGYRVVLAQDGADAIRAARKVRPDAVILDIRMPRMGGFEASKQIKQTDPAVPIILFTMNDEDCLSDTRSCCAMACVEKSEDLSELKLALTRALTVEADERPFSLGLPSRRSR